MKALFSVACLLTFVSCGSPGDGFDGGSKGNTPVCNVTAQTSYQTGSPITGSGTVSCSESAQLSIKVCLYMKNPSDSAWGNPVICADRSNSGTSISTTTQVGAGGLSKNYRTVVEGNADGVSVQSQTSSPVTAP